MKNKAFFIILLGLLVCTVVQAQVSFGEAKKFNENWLFSLSDDSLGASASYDDSKWRKLDLPHDCIAGQLHDALRGVVRTGGDHVDDQQVIAVSDCGLDGLVLRGLVAVGVEVLIGNAQRVQLCIESGADAGDVGVGIGVVEHGDLQIGAHRGVAVVGVVVVLSGVGSGLRSVRRCLGLVVVAAAGDQSNDHDKDKKKRKKFFHCHSSSINFCGISVPRN